jgi:hypothetical protein
VRERWWRRRGYQELFAHVTHLGSFDDMSYVVPRLEGIFNAAQGQSFTGERERVMEIER